jgi:hypothetical protein
MIRTPERTEWFNLVEFNGTAKEEGSCDYWLPKKRYNFLQEQDLVKLSQT